MMNLIDLALLSGNKTLIESNNENNEEQTDILGYVNNLPNGSFIITNNQDKELNALTFEDINTCSLSNNGSLDFLITEETIIYYQPSNFFPKGFGYDEELSSYPIGQFNVNAVLVVPQSMSLNEDNSKYEVTEYTTSPYEDIIFTYNSDNTYYYTIKIKNISEMLEDMKTKKISEISGDYDNSISPNNDQHKHNLWPTIVMECYWAD